MKGEKNKCNRKAKFVNNRNETNYEEGLTFDNKFCKKKNTN